MSEFKFEVLYGKETTYKHCEYPNCGKDLSEDTISVAFGPVFRFSENCKYYCLRHSVVALSELRETLKRDCSHKITRITAEHESKSDEIKDMIAFLKPLITS